MCALSPTAFPLPRPPCFDPRCRAPRARPFRLLSAACRAGPGRLADNTPYETDPRTNDTDGDGLNDTQELMNLSDPRSGDTDHDSLGDLAEASTPGAPAEYEAEPPHIQDVQMRFISFSGFLWGLVDPVLVLEVGFDTYDNVGVDTAVVRMSSPLMTLYNTTRLPHDTNLHHVVADIPVTIFEHLGSGADINITLSDVHGNKLWGQWHQQSIGEQAWNYIVAVFHAACDLARAACDLVVSAVSAVGAFVQHQLEQAFTTLVNGMTALAQYMVGDFFQAVGEAVQSGDIMGHLPAVADAFLTACDRVILFVFLMEAVEGAVNVLLAVLSAGASELIFQAVAHTAAELAETALIGLIVHAATEAVVNAVLGAPDLGGYVVDWLAANLGLGLSATLIATHLMELFIQAKERRAANTELAFALTVFGLITAVGSSPLADGMYAQFGFSNTGWIPLILGMMGLGASAGSVLLIYLHSSEKKGENLLHQIFNPITNSIEHILTAIGLFITGAEMGVNLAEGRYLPVVG